MTVIRSVTGGGQIFFCPGCQDTHAINIGKSCSRWYYNGNSNKPTFTPSILVTTGHYAGGTEEDGCWCKYNKEHPEEKDPFVCVRCHSFVTEGRIQFLVDSTHALAGQTVDLLEWPYAPGTYSGIEDIPHD